MARGKARKKSSMRGRRSLNDSRSVDAREMGAAISAEAGLRTATSAKRRMPSKSAAAGKISAAAAKSSAATRSRTAAKRGRRPRKSDI